MKFSALLVLGILTLTTTSVVAVDKLDDPWEFKEPIPPKIRESVRKDFGVCALHFFAQFDFVGWILWEDESYAILFQDDPIQSVSGGIEGSATPQFVLFKNLKHGGGGRHAEIFFSDKTYNIVYTSSITHASRVAAWGVMETQRAKIGEIPKRYGRYSCCKCLSE